MMHIRRFCTLRCLGVVTVILLATVLVGCRREGGGQVSNSQPAPQPVALTGPSPNLALIPPDAVGFVHINVAGLMETEQLKAIRQQLGDEGMESIGREFHFGVPITEVHSATFAVAGPEPEELTIVTTSKPYDRDKLLKDLLSEPAEFQHKGKTLYWNKRDVDFGGGATKPTPGATDPGPPPPPAPKPTGETVKPREGLEPADLDCSPHLSAAPLVAQPKPNQPSPWARMVYLVNDHTFILSRVRSLQRYLDNPPQPGAQGPLSKALAMPTDKHHIIGAISIPESLQKEIEKGAARAARHDFFPAVALQGVKPAIQAQLGTLTVDVGGETQANLTFTYADEARAKDAVGEVKDGLALLRLTVGAVSVMAAQEPEGAMWIEALKKVETALRNATVEQQGTTVKVSASVTLDAGTVAKAAANLKETADRVQSQNNLRQIALAMHNRANEFRDFPPHALYSKDGKPLLSWRVMILPYIEEQKLFEQFKLDEPWDSEHNKKLLEKMPKVYATPGVKTKEPYTTYYQGFFGSRAFFEANPAAILPVKPGPHPNTFVPAMSLSFNSFYDGTANTLMVVEAGEPVPWTKPADLPFDPMKPPLNLVGPKGAGFNAAFCDGHVRSLKKGIDPQLLRKLIDRADGEVIDYDEIMGRADPGERHGSSGKTIAAPEEKKPEK